MFLPQKIQIHSIIKVLIIKTLLVNVIRFTIKIFIQNCVIYKKTDTLELKEEDLLIETTKSEKYVSSQEEGMVVVLDIELNDELIEEGFVRELISKIQNLRKESGFEVQNHIEIYYSDNEKLEKIISKNASQIADETLADKIAKGEGDTELDINGEKLKIKLT